MKKNYLFLILPFCHSLVFSQTPITLGNSNMPGSGDTLRYTNVQLNSVSNYTQTGPNQTWNFQTAVSTTEGRRDFKSALQTPYALFFLSLNEYGEKIADTLVGGTGTITITKYYNFYKKQTSPNAFVADGVGLSINNVPVPTYYSDKDEIYNFPMTYPKYDSTTFKFSTPTTTALPLSIKYSKQGYRVTVVDGWGSITTPFGTDNCLRLVTTQYSKDTTEITLPTNTVIPIPLPPIKIGFQNNQRSYQWLTTSSKIPFFEVSGNVVAGNFTPTTARYRGFNKNPAPPPPPPPPPNPTTALAEQQAVTFEMYPNPVSDQLVLRGLGACNLQLFDMNGKLLQTQVTGDSEHRVDVSGLSKGMYFLKIKGASADQYLRFVKQ